MLIGTRAPDLAVTMGDGAILCEAPQPRLRYPRLAATVKREFETIRSLHAEYLDALKKTYVLPSVPVP